MSTCARLSNFLLEEIFSTSVQIVVFSPFLGNALCLHAWSSEVEPLAKYIPVLSILCEANDINPRTAPREIALIASQSGDGKITVAHLAEKHRISKWDFVKCDIEGGEYDIFLHNNEWIDDVQNVAMELHGNREGNQSIRRALERAGLTVLATDQFGKTVDVGDAVYLYAARDGSSLRESC